MIHRGNKALWSGLINHQFPLRPAIKPGGYVRGGRLTSHEGMIGGTQQKKTRDREQTHLKGGESINFSRGTQNSEQAS